MLGILFLVALHLRELEENKKEEVLEEEGDLEKEEYLEKEEDLEKEEEIGEELTLDWCERSLGRELWFKWGEGGGIVSSVIHCDGAL